MIDRPDPNDINTPYEPDEDDDVTYKIIRFRFNDENKVVKRGLSLAEAQAHCHREDTHGDGWFDGYDVDTPTALDEGYDFGPSEEEPF